MSKKIKKVISGGLLGGILGGDTPKMPKPEKAKVMPSPDDEAARLARRRNIASQVKRGGRASTILTDKETLG
jgi:hypothetical protein